MNMNKCFSIFTLILSVSGSQSYAQIYKWVDEHGRTQFGDQPHPSAQKITVKDSKMSATVVVPLEKPKHIEKRTLRANEFLEIVKLLKLKKFKELNRLLKQMEHDYKVGKLHEDVLFAAYEAFSINDRSFIDLFDSWVAATPDKYQAYLGRGIYLYGLGWMARGSKWESETKESSIEEMTKYFDGASSDFFSSLDYNNSTIVPYYYLIGKATTLGHGDEAEWLMRKALKIQIGSYQIRLIYLKSLTPRWGGSIEKMQSYLGEVSGIAQGYPELQPLFGYIYREVGDAQVQLGKYNAADGLYTESLRFGDRHELLFRRGKNNNRRESYTDSIPDLSRAIEISPHSAMYYYWRASSYMKLSQYKLAMNDIQIGMELAPYDGHIQKKKKRLTYVFKKQAYELRKNQELGSAIKKYSDAVLLSPSDADIYHGRARAYIGQRNLDLALKDIKKAIEINPSEINYYSLLDYILAKYKSWDEIIKYWDQFIMLNPNNGRAYVERGGAYFHKGDIKSAMKNAKLSADLGNLEGMEAYSKFKHMLQ